MSLSSDSVVLADVSPLWELQYTGISNVVLELTQRLLREQRFAVEFTVMGKLVRRTLIEQCVADRKGTALHVAFKQEEVTEVELDANRCFQGMRSIGLFTNTKPPQKVYGVDTQVYYDFSPLLTPECHTTDTVRHHMAGIIGQVGSCDDVFCISESTAADMASVFGVDRKRIHVALLGNNVDLSATDKVKRLLGASTVEPFFLILGTIEPRKNLALVLRWLEQNRQVCEIYRFVFAGREGWGPSFCELADSCGALDLVEAGRIIHLGYVDEMAKAALLVGAQALIFPSVFEGFGLPVLEAMTVGTLVISSCSTSLPEVLGDCGYYFDPESPASLQAAFHQFLADQRAGFHTPLRDKARIRASSFSYDNFYEVVAGVLERHAKHARHHINATA